MSAGGSAGAFTGTLWMPQRYSIRPGRSPARCVVRRSGSSAPSGPASASCCRTYATGAGSSRSPVRHSSRACAGVSQSIPAISPRFSSSSSTSSGVPTRVMKYRVWKRIGTVGGVIHVPASVKRSPSIVWCSSSRISSNVIWSLSSARRSARRSSAGGGGPTVSSSPVSSNTSRATACSATASSSAAQFRTCALPSLASIRPPGNAWCPAMKRIVSLRRISRTRAPASASSAGRSGLPVKMMAAAARFGSTGSEGPASVAPAIDRAAVCPSARALASAASLDAGSGWAMGSPRRGRGSSHYGPRPGPPKA
jgi:hypothetical protein